MKMMMMMMMMPAALLLLLPVTLAESIQLSPIQLVVNNSLQNTPPLTYTTHVAYRGILLGAMNRLMNSDTDFKFTYTEDPNYGPFLESVNGLAGNAEDHTYWELLVELVNGTIIRPNVGIGCYIPAENETIILNYTTW